MLQRWALGPENAPAADACTAVEVFDRGPEAAADWLATIREEEIAEVGRRMQSMARDYDDPARARLCGGMGSTLGWMLEHSLSAKDLPRAFRAGLASFQLWTVLRETGRPGWSAFESRLRGPLQTPPSRESEGPEEKDAWSDWGPFEDFVLKSAGVAADRHGLDDRAWGDIRRAVESGVHKAKDPGSWESRYGGDPVVRGLIEKDYHTTFKRPLPAATP
jgi:hypothetical protein